MFGGKEKTQLAKNTINTASNALNSLVKGTEIEGTVKAESDIRIDGTIKGNLDCAAKVIIGPTGYVEGHVNCENAIIEGQFEGILNVKELLNVRNTAKINGEISTNKLIVEAGLPYSTSRVEWVSKKHMPESQQPKKRKSENSPKKQVKSYVKYSGMAIQMGVTIAFFAYIGKYIDDRYATPKPYWTMGFSLLGVLAALYFLLKDVINDK